MRFILGCLIIVSVSSGSSKPLLFASLVESLQKSTQSIEKLSRSSVMGENKHLLRHFLTRVEGTLSVGNELSEAKEVDQELISRYLSDLRKLSQTKESIDALYRQSLWEAIEQSDKKSFEALIDAPLNLPIKMESVQGIVAYPRKGDRYTVQ